MDLNAVMFHAPYVLRDALILTVLPALALGAAAWRGNYRPATRLALLFMGLALIVGGGIALTTPTPNAHAANLALGRGVGLITAGTATVIGATFRRRSRVSNDR